LATSDWTLLEDLSFMARSLPESVLPTMTSPSSPTPADDDLDIGLTLRGLRPGWKVFERYKLVRQLGRGGMGVVWLGHDEKLDLDIALKFLPDNLLHDEIALDDLRRETRRCMKLAHQHIVHVYDFVTDDSIAAIAMEFVDGKSLSALRLEQPGKVFEVAQLTPLVRQVCEALTYAHEQARLVHYDLKPGNLMLTSGGLVKVMDFGIAASINDSASRQSSARSTAGMGTLHYMSPQQLSGYPPAVSDDVYSLGATMYELLTGRPPFHGFRDRALEEQIQQAVPPRMGQRREELGVKSAAAISEAWEQTIAACLEKEPEKRPRSVREVWQRLGELDSRPVEQPVRAKSSPSAIAQPSSRIADPSSPVSRSHKPVLSALAALLCVGGALGWWLWLGVEAPRRAEAARIEQQRREQEMADAAEAARLAQERSEAETARLAKEKADAEEKARQMAARKAAEARGPASATKESPFTNSLGMKFVPVPVNAGPSKGQRILFSIWETRSKDYAAFVTDSGYDAGEDWKSYSYKDVPVGRGEGERAEDSSHPVANVSHDDAVAFCAWLTKKDRASGQIGPQDEYRLPSDVEWSYAVGIGNQEDDSASPMDKLGKLEGVYPWGATYPPPAGSGNYADTTAKSKFGSDWSTIESYTDGHATTAPVGSFKANALGLYDLGGNLWEWTSSPWETGSTPRVLRGASWYGCDASLTLSSYRFSCDAGIRDDYIGFRCVLVVGGG
jgi:serine/threonine protein kinase